MRAEYFFGQACGCARQSRQSPIVEVGSKATGGVQGMQACSAVSRRFELPPSGRLYSTNCIDLARAISLLAPWMVIASASAMAACAVSASQTKLEKSKIAML